MLYNPNSIVIQNMSQQLSGVQPTGCTPPVPIGNIASITGAAGYNGGYYNGCYNNYYNPYLAAKQEEARKAQEKELRQQHSEAMKLLSKAAHAVDNSEISEETLNELYDYHPIDEMSKEDKLWIEMQQLSQQQPREFMGYKNACNAVYNKVNKYVRPDMTLEEFLQNGFDIKMDILAREQENQDKDLSKLYNKEYYDSLIESGNGQEYYRNKYSSNMFKPEVSIDDMSILSDLPKKLKTEYAAKRAQFMEKIMNGAKV